MQGTPVAQQMETETRPSIRVMNFGGQVLEKLVWQQRGKAGYRARVLRESSPRYALANQMRADFLKHAHIWIMERGPITQNNIITHGGTKQRIRKGGNDKEFEVLEKDIEIISQSQEQHFAKLKTIFWVKRKGSRGSRTPRLSLGQDHYVLLAADGPINSPLENREPCAENSGRAEGGAGEGGECGWGGDGDGRSWVEDTVRRRLVASGAGSTEVHEFLAGPSPSDRPLHPHPRQILHPNNTNMDTDTNTSSNEAHLDAALTSWLPIPDIDVALLVPLFVSAPSPPSPLTTMAFSSGARGCGGGGSRHAALTATKRPRRRRPPRSRAAPNPKLGVGSDTAPAYTHTAPQNAAGKEKEKQARARLRTHAKLVIALADADVAGEAVDAGGALFAPPHFSASATSSYPHQLSLRQAEALGYASEVELLRSPSSYALDVAAADGDEGQEEGDESGAHAGAPMGLTFWYLWIPSSCSSFFCWASYVERRPEVSVSRDAYDIRIPTHVAGGELRASSVDMGLGVGFLTESRVILILILFLDSRWRCVVDCVQFKWWTYSNPRLVGKMTGGIGVIGLQLPAEFVFFEL
ncbi:hypothetical protein C8R45DRAFT_1069611 [Mycena sanguinolenta]|nr:hypothetical protein C8R45DRAFT_1069611 [Mycena sanguinolenta]